MPVWPGLPLALQPLVILDGWQIVRAPGGALHFTGRHIAGREAKVSTPVVAFDPKRLIGRTQSGRIYQLIGESTPSRDNGYVLAGWCAVNEVDFDTLEFVGLDTLVDLPRLE